MYGVCRGSENIAGEFGRFGLFLWEKWRQWIQAVYQTTCVFIKKTNHSIRWIHVERAGEYSFFPIGHMVSPDLPCLFSVLCPRWHDAAGRRCCCRRTQTSRTNSICCQQAPKRKMTTFRPIQSAVPGIFETKQNPAQHKTITWSD